MKTIISQIWDERFSDVQITHETMLKREIVKTVQERLVLVLECGHSEDATLITMKQKSTRCFVCDPERITEAQRNRYDELNDQLKEKIRIFNEQTILSEILESAEDIRYAIDNGLKVNTARIGALIDRIKEAKQ